MAVPAGHPLEENKPRFVVVSDTRYHCATRPEITVCAGQLWCSEFRSLQCNAPGHLGPPAGRRRAKSTQDRAGSWLDDQATPQLRHPARLRPESGRWRPPPQAVRSPTQALHPGAAAPRLLPTAHRRAGGRIPRETRPRRPGRAAPGPGSIAPCPTPGPVPARTGPGRVSQRLCAPVRPAPAGPGRSPLRPRSLPASSPSQPVLCAGVWQRLRAPGAQVVGQLVDPYPCALATAWHRGEHPRHAPPPPGNAAPRCSAVLRRLRVESRANGEVSSVMASAMRVRS